MKKCPSCGRAFTDDSLSFCLDDGSPLLSVGAGGGGAAAGANQPAARDAHATWQYTQARETNPPPTEAFGTGQQFPPQTPSWSPVPPAGAATAQPKKSKAIYWVLGVVLLLAVAVVGGAILVIALAGFSENGANNSNQAGNRNAANTNNANGGASNKNTGGATDKRYRVRDDFSATGWWTGTNDFGKAEYVNGQYQMTAAGYWRYVVVYGPRRDEYLTEDVITRATARSVTGTSPSLGYGLTIFGKNDRLEDYAFLIRTNESPAFRVVLHKDGQETVLVNWTRSSLIRGGSTPNQLEVRVKDDQLTFYINGQYATSINDTAGLDTGYVGFYSSDTEPVAFDDLEIYEQL